MRAFYHRLRAANRALGCDFFEGAVMKRADSSCPVQLRSAIEEFRGLMKHRFLKRPERRHPLAVSRWAFCVFTAPEDGIAETVLGKAEQITTPTSNARSHESLHFFHSYFHRNYCFTRYCSTSNGADGGVIRYVELQYCWQLCFNDSDSI